MSHSRGGGLRVVVNIDQNLSEEEVEFYDGGVDDLEAQLRDPPHAPIQAVSYRGNMLVADLSDMDPNVEGVHAVANTMERWVRTRTDYHPNPAFISVV